jgi:hypothetical protein
MKLFYNFIRTGWERYTFGKIPHANLGAILQSCFSNATATPSKKTERFLDTETSPFLTVLLVCIFALYFALKSKFCTYILTSVLLIYRRKNKVIHSF